MQEKVETRTDLYYRYREGASETLPLQGAKNIIGVSGLAGKQGNVVLLLGCE